MVIQLDLFDGVQHAAHTPSQVTTSDAEARLVFNPCTCCRYLGLCDSGECAMKCFPLDADKAYDMSKAESEYLSMLRRQGW